MMNQVSPPVDPQHLHRSTPSSLYTDSPPYCADLSPESMALQILNIFQQVLSTSWVLVSTLHQLFLLCRPDVRSPTPLLQKQQTTTTAAAKAPPKKIDQSLLPPPLPSPRSDVT